MDNGSFTGKNIDLASTTTTSNAKALDGTPSSSAKKTILNTR